MPYVSDDYYLSNPRPQPPVEPQHTTAQPSYNQDTYFPDPPTYSQNPPTYSQNTHFPDPPTYTQNTFFPDQPTYTQNTLFPNPSSYTPQQHTSIPQSQPDTQTYNPSDYTTPQQTRNFFDRVGFESPGTQRFNQHYAHYTNQPIQPQPTQPFNQNTEWEQSNDFLNLSLAAYAATHGGGESSTAVHGGEGSTIGAGSPMIEMHNFLEITRNDGQQYGRGHRQGHPPGCGTGGHMDRQN
jgi:hypothetical protein